MLILARKVGESIVIDGRIIVRVLFSEENRVRLGIDAPPEVPVHRTEVFLRIHRANHAALTAKGPPSAATKGLVPSASAFAATPATDGSQ